MLYLDSLYQNRIKEFSRASDALRLQKAWGGGCSAVALVLAVSPTLAEGVLTPITTQVSGAISYTGAGNGVDVQAGGELVTGASADKKEFKSGAELLNSAGVIDNTAALSADEGVYLSSSFLNNQSQMALLRNLEIVE